MNVHDIVGKNVKAYREAADLSQEVLALKAYISPDIVAEIEKCRDVDNKFYYLMRIAETLGITYYDLFEHKDGKTALKNVTIPKKAIDIIFSKASRTGISRIALAKAIGARANTLWYWKSGKGVPTAFFFHNLITFLKLNSSSFKEIVEPPSKAEKVEEKQEVAQEGIKQPDVMSEVIKACNAYKQLQGVIDRLDEIIKKASELKAELEKAV